MAAPAGAIRYHQNNQTLTFRVEGRATMFHSLPFRRLAERALENGTTSLRVDLRDCSYLDSTFLGTLLTLKKAVERHHGQLTLLTPSPACLKIMHQMGLTDVLSAEDGPADPVKDWTELDCETSDPAFRRTVLQAHEELATLPGPAGEQFQAVVRCLGRDEPPAPPESSNQPPK